jgi:5-methylcytosine-specific restriction endonuclease McrA
VSSDPRSHRWYRAQVAGRRQQWAARQAPCVLCGQRIDYSLPPDDPQAFTVEHTVPLSVDRARHYDPTNWQPAHRSCNSSRGNRPPPLDLGTPSRRW